MKGKEKFEVMFICILILVVGGLLYIYFADLDTEFLPNSVKDIFKKQDYEIIDKIEECNETSEEFYSDDNYVYYFNCRKSHLIYLEYEDGTIKPMMEELNSGNVKIDSLLDHGLRCSKKSIIEENGTLEENETNSTEENETNED